VHIRERDNDRGMVEGEEARLARILATLAGRRTPEGRGSRRLARHAIGERSFNPQGNPFPPTTCGEVLPQPVTESASIPALTHLPSGPFWPGFPATHSAAAPLLSLSRRQKTAAIPSSCPLPPAAASPAALPFAAVLPASRKSCPALEGQRLPLDLALVARRSCCPPIAAGPQPNSPSAPVRRFLAFPAAQRCVRRRGIDHQRTCAAERPAARRKAHNGDPQ